MCATLFAPKNTLITKSMTTSATRSAQMEVRVIALTIYIPAIHNVRKNILSRKIMIRPAIWPLITSITQKQIKLLFTSRVRKMLSTTFSTQAGITNMDTGHTTGMRAGTMLQITNTKSTPVTRSVQIMRLSTWNKIITV